MKMKLQCSMFKILLAASFILLSSFSEARITKIKKSLCFVPHHLGDVALLHSEEKGFWVVQNGQEHPVDDFLLDQQLQGISSNALDAFLCDGLISIIPHDSGEFELEACHSEAGKGPYTGLIAYNLVKTAAWGVVMYAAAGATGLLDKEVVGQGAAGAGEFLGSELTQGASEGRGIIAGTLEQIGLSPGLAKAGAELGTGAVTISGAQAAAPIIEALALIAFIGGCFLPGG